MFKGRKKREIQAYLEDIMKECEYLIKTSEGLTFEKFIEDETLKRAFVRSLELIGEAVKHLPQDFRKKHSDVPWKEIAGMRDILIHEYFGIDYQLVWVTIKEDIPYLKKILESILDTEEF